jgi:hypothetical protein
MKVVGLYLVRNEIDIIQVNLHYHHATVLDEAIVVDNGSTDGTLELVTRMAGELPLTVASEPGGYAQSELLTRMARQASRAGADWLLPIDADEFWVGNGRSIRSVLETTPDEAGVLRCEVVNFVQRREELAPKASSLLTTVMRVAEPVGPPERADELVESGQIGFVERQCEPKIVSRAAPTISIYGGGEGVDGVPGEARHTDAVICLRAPLRSRSMLSAKIDLGRRVEEEGFGSDEAGASRRLWRMAREGRVDGLWEASSYEGGALTVGGRRRPLIPDRRLATAVATWVDSGVGQRVGFLHDLDPLVGAYVLAMPTVPGWFSEIDVRLFVELSGCQRRRGVVGDLMEIGVFHGKSAILLGYLAGTDERLVVNDLFNESVDTTPGNLEDNQRWYEGFERRHFEQQYQRFHSDLPEILVGNSTEIDRKAMANRFRFVHVDGSHEYDIVREDILTAEALLVDGGIVAFDDISTPHNPGSALAIWEAVLGGRMKPICLTDAKLYATWDEDPKPWTDAVRAWAKAQPDLVCQIRLLAGFDVARIVSHGSPGLGQASPPPGLVPGVLVPLEPLDAPADQTRAELTRPRSRAREVAKLIAPPVAVMAYRRARAWGRRLRAS